MNEDFSLGKMSADARLTATFKYYEKTEQNGKIVITACLGKGDVPKLNRGYGLDGNELWLSLNNLYQSIRGKDDYTAADDIISWCQQYAHPTMPLRTSKNIVGILKRIRNTGIFPLTFLVISLLMFTPCGKISKTCTGIPLSS
ncbi:MAG: hypothetical protein ACLR1C_07560 [Agathobacter rectalis]